MKKVVMFNGKGGVGKSTISASAGIYFALNKKRTLVISTDPAPSLSNIFHINLHNKISMIKEDLYGIEISEDEIIRKWKEKFGREIYEVIRAFADVDEGIVDYIGTAPGIEEEFMLDYILDLAKNKNFDVIIWDTAPMGSTLKLLSMPSKFMTHLNLATKIYTKFKGNSKPIYEIINEWKELSESIIEFLKNDVYLIAVCIPEELAVYQTKKLLNEFENFNIKVQKIVINNVIQKGICNNEFMMKKFEIQRKYVDEIKKVHKNVVEIPLFEEITDKNLIEIGKKIFNDKDDF